MSDKDLIVRKKETVKRTLGVTLSASHVVEYLRSRGVDVSDNCRVFVRVPGGGDWSNMDLDIGIDADIEVAWTTTEESEQ